MGLFTLDRDLLPENWGKTGPSGKPVLGEPPAPARKEASSEASMRAETSKEPIYLVTDTSWWMEDGWRIATGVAERLRDGEAFFVVPAGVMRELDGLKKNPEKGKRALEAIKRIEELIRKGRARIETRKSEYYNALASKTDEEVVAVAKRLKEKGRVRLVSFDNAQKALARDVGIIALHLNSPKNKEPKWFDKDVFFFFVGIGFLLSLLTKNFFWETFFVIIGIIWGLWPLSHSKQKKKYHSVFNEESFYEPPDSLSLYQGD